MSLITHCGARQVTRQELDRVEAPSATPTWFPLKHSTVVDTVAQSLEAGGFEIRGQQFALSRGDARLFSTMDLTAPVGTGVHLAIGIRNSTDKSLPLGFCAGSRVFVCDNLAFRSELVVSRKHTRFGQSRFAEAISQAVQALQQFQEVETDRVQRFRTTLLSAERADSILLRAYRAEIVSHRLLPQVIREYEQPSVQYDSERNSLWNLLQAFSLVMGKTVLRGNPQRFSLLTIRLQQLMDSRPEFVAPA